MRRLAAGPALLLLAAASGGAGEGERFRWDREGLATVREAAAAAREGGKRLLLGLSGSPT